MRYFAGTDNQRKDNVMGQVTPTVQPTTGFLGFFETTVGRAIRRAALGALALAATAFLGSIINNPTFSNAVPNDTLPFILYWVARTVMDLLNPKISNLN